ncbi:MAG: CrcB family protein [Oleiphilaceae bacterium]|nr:CrcB family protein [Oleiphilaceae bacterium]
MSPRAAFWVALGSLLGSLSRHALQQWLPEATWSGLPLATLSVNVAGSLLIGWLAGRAMPPHPTLATLHRRHFAMTGFCGGFTTFSLFTLETLVLIETGAWSQAWLNLGLTTALALVAVALGFRMGRTGRKPE